MVDLPSYDYLFSRFVKGDWGKNQITNPNEIVRQISMFLIETEKKNIALSKEQLCMYINEIYTADVTRILKPNHRIYALRTIANLEKRSGILLQTPYFDELYDFFDIEFTDFI